MITLDRLRYFVAVATSQHIGRASRVLGVSPSALSSALRSLEQELGGELFLREKKRLKLNERGAQFLVGAQKLIEDAARLKAGFASEAIKWSGHYRLGGSHYLVEKFLAPTCLALRSKFPDVTFELVSVDTSLASAQVRTGNLDGALVYRSDYTEAFSESVLLSDQFRIAVRRNHPILKEKRAGALRRLNELPAFTFRPSLGIGLWERHPALGAADILPKHSCFYDDSRIAIQWVAQTDGWAFLPRSVIALERSLREVQALKFSVDAAVNISFITSGRRNRGGFFGIIESEISGRLAGIVGATAVDRVSSPRQ